MLRNRYDQLHSRYTEAGLSENEIDQLLVLDIKAPSYFLERRMTSQHGGGNLFASDPAIMGWLFQKRAQI